MAKRKTSRRERVTSVNATTQRPKLYASNAVVRRAAVLPRVTPPITFSPILALEDRREWHPERQHKPVRAIRRSATAIVARDRLHSPNSQTKAILAFKEPEKLALCVRREVRKRVMHAINKAGRSGQKRRTTNPQSKISCRR